MRKIIFKVMLIFSAVVFLWTGQALAADILLFNTGVDNTKAVLAGGAIDPHYTITYSTDTAFPGPNAYVAYEGYPIGPWLDNTGTSKWIAPAANADQDFGWQYTYSTYFSLAGLNPATASISGQVAGDDWGYIYLNGNQVGTIGTYTAWNSFSISSSPFFVSGTNQLDFVVTNSGWGPSGLRVEMSGNANAVPVPATLLLLAPGLAGIGMLRRKFSK